MTSTEVRYLRGFDRAADPAPSAPSAACHRLGVRARDRHPAGSHSGSADPDAWQRPERGPILAADVRATLKSDHGFQTLSAGRVRTGVVTFAGLGEEDGAIPTPQTRYEMGSITKTFTGMLLADAITRGEMNVEDRLAQHLPELAGTPAGDITLFELATHSSGLPSIPSDLVRPVLTSVLGNDNPYDISVAGVIEASRTVKLKDQGKYAYSNLGMSLLGHAEARAAGVPDWPTLATQRILQPLGMTATTFAMTASGIPAGVLAGHHSNGWRAPYWYGPGFAPAGSGAWTTAEDLTRFATAVLAGKAPGMAALEPEAESDTGEIGFGVAHQRHRAPGDHLAQRRDERDARRAGPGPGAATGRHSPRQQQPSD